MTKERKKERNEERKKERKARERQRDLVFFFGEKIEMLIPDKNREFFD